MSVKAPNITVEYQSHHHCQCDFCNSRRNLNSKKNALSSTVAHLKEQQALNNCCCSCHDALSRRNYDRKPKNPSFELDNPEHHVNQTALNACKGRTGLQNGDKYTTALGPQTTYQNTGADANCSAKSIAEQEKEAMEDLDRLERLLVLEHKARVKAAADAENFELLRKTGKGPRPVPFEATEVPVSKPVTPQGTVIQPGNVREAYDAAHRCSVTPPPHCEDSHRLQHIMENVRSVTRDPANKDNAAVLNAVLKRGDGESSLSSKRGSTGAPSDAGSGSRFQGNFIGIRPEGAGVVWRQKTAGGEGDFYGFSKEPGNTDNRDLWKATLLKNQTVVEN
uniref:Uncharacterized protein TCIL3000_10_12400 n=1 Tax=Trypanosoma congolense (strain IL3000) TaxID=1068625 RepID=G0UYJ1_TRYCI|nr:unnamed protein product [Trypanosoma congolense IL3000]